MLSFSPVNGLIILGSLSFSFWQPSGGCMQPEDVTQPIHVNDLNQLSQSQFGIDISRFFSGTETHLAKVEPHGFYQFTSARSGDDRFYIELMQKLAYNNNRDEFVEAAKHVSSNFKVLDIGCGPGWFADVCKGHYKGIDLNPDAVNLARSKGRNVHLEKLEDQIAGGFDVVTMFQVLEHVDRPESFIAAAARCVANGGKLIIATPDMEGYIGGSVNHLLNYPPHHMSWWSADSIGSLIRANGFSVESVWHERLQPDHLQSWIFSLLHPRRGPHMDMSSRAKMMDLASKVLSRAFRPFYNPVPHLTGQSVMVVGQRPR